MGLLAGHSQGYCLLLEWGGVASEEKKKCLTATKLNALISPQKYIVASSQDSLRYGNSVVNVKHACAGPLPKGFSNACYQQVIYTFKQ